MAEKERMIHQKLTRGESNGRLPSTGASVGGKDLLSLVYLRYVRERTEGKIHSDFQDGLMHN